MSLRSERLCNSLSLFHVHITNDWAIWHHTLPSLFESSSSSMNCAASSGSLTSRELLSHFPSCLNVSSWKITMKGVTTILSLLDGMNINLRWVFKTIPIKVKVLICLISENTILSLGDILCHVLPIEHKLLRLFYGSWYLPGLIVDNLCFHAATAHLILFLNINYRNRSLKVLKI